MDIAGGEVCDDGNTANGDGCSAACAVEAGYKCQSVPDLVTSPGGPWYSVCYIFCGDGVVTAPETCDDGNAYSDDGCSSVCTIEQPAGEWNCPVVGDPCTEVCDGVDHGNLLCDGQAGGGCSATCTMNAGWHCRTPHQVEPHFNAGLIECEEICGDGIENTAAGFGGLSTVKPPSINATIYQQSKGGYCEDYFGFTYRDGCDRLCRRTGGYEEWNQAADPHNRWVDNYVAGTFPNYFKELCGDADWKVLHHYACEDGNLIAGDGCDVANGCQVEYGYECGEGDSLEYDVCKEICGDGHVLGNYECDDGNKFSGDGCDQLCRVEPGWNCTGGGPGTFGITVPVQTQVTNINLAVIGGGAAAAAGATIDDPDPDICVEICGDGRDFGNYECDDGNNDNGDGCDFQCNIEPGWECYNGNKDVADTCVEICGDGNDLGTYPCDDGNSVNGDGCDKLCQVEDGWYCRNGEPDATGGAAAPDVCIEVPCDGLRVGVEECDDGASAPRFFNAAFQTETYTCANGDGCSTTMTVEAGWNCTGGSRWHRDFCQEICGDGEHRG